MPDSRPNLIAERYRLVGQIGQGGMGRVWAARDELLARDVAIKELVPSAGLTQAELGALRERTIREARAIAMLDHPNVVRIFDVVFDRGEPWIVMELVPSRSLFDTVRDDGPMAPDRVARVGLGVLAALRAAHRTGLLHRDVKPGNVLLAHDGRVVLTDFGLATAAGDASMTSTGIVLGSPQYLAPERALDREIGPPADLWSLGATLYTAVEGRPPYVRSSPMATLAALATELPAAPERAGVLRHALTALLQRDPALRADAETAQRLLLAATSPGAAPPPQMPRYESPTFAVPNQRTPAPVLPPPIAASGDPLAVLEPVPRKPVDPLAVLAPRQAGAGAESGPPLGNPAAPDGVGGSAQAGPPPDPDGRSGSTVASPVAKPRSRRRALGVAAVVALLVTGGLVAYPMISGGSTADPQPDAALVVPSAGEAGGVGNPIASVPVRTTRPRPSASAAGHPTGTNGSVPGSVKPTKPASATPAAATPTTTSAAAVAGRQFVSHSTGTCLYAPGTTGRIQSWACNGDAGQRFTHPSDGTLRVRGKCVQIAGTGDGATLDLATCTGAQAQQWNYNDSYDLVNLWAIKCVDIPDASSANGVVVQVWECSGASHQKWDY
ncbi:protein kinase [Actinoplanes sp. NPDC026670]|uniref:protein kinase domain-containing protein n=1 Tax=Actinoplanes sp. NPDC026670 TaxID=3154700 RepID=UPI0033E305B6